MPVVWYAIHCVESYYLTGRYRDAIDWCAAPTLEYPPHPWRMGFQLASEAELGDGSAAATLADSTALSRGDRRGPGLHDGFPKRA